VTPLGLFIIIPNLSAYMQHNLGHPREQLGVIYMVGGAVSFLAVRLTGPLVDRFGATRLIVFGTVLHVFTLSIGFIRPVTHIPAVFVFVCFMVSGSIRTEPNSSLATRVPRPEQCAGFTVDRATHRLIARSDQQRGDVALGA
jgi:predicted MFS family arabinose efflux permease